MKLYPEKQKSKTQKDELTAGSSAGSWQMPHTFSLLSLLIMFSLLNAAALEHTTR